MMTPEEVSKAYSKLRRYNTSFDLNVDQYCPPLVRIKNGNIAKRQPHVRQMGTDYWKAQCSFRSLKTSGKVDELKDRIRGRDRGKDITIKQDLDKVQALLDTHHKQMDEENLERWWQDASIKLELKIESDAHRALKELLERDPDVLNSALVVQTRSNALVYWAEKLGLSCQTVEPPESMLAGTSDWLGPGSWSVIGRADLVLQQVNKLTDQANSEARQAKARADAAKEARRVELQKQQDVLLSEAKRQADWDLTGSWIVKCTELACYLSEQPEKLTMEVYVDDFDVDDARGPDAQSDDEYEGYQEYEEGSGIQPRKATAAISKNKANIPRYCASFHFGVVEGVMRIYPPASSRSKTAAFKVSTSPRFEYIWRGRETGESEIQTRADENVLPITFGNHGTTFEGTFHCDYLQPVKIVGQKISHGRGRKMSSETQWSDLTERAWERERVGRWG